MDKESDLVGRKTAAQGHKLPWSWLYFRSFLLLLYPLLLCFLSLLCFPLCLQHQCISIAYLTVIYQSHTFDTDVPLLNRHCRDSLEVLVLSGGADLGGVALCQFIQASGILKLELGLPAEEVL